MRTRSSGAASPEPLGQPKSTRRKRDSGVYLCDEAEDVEGYNGPPENRQSTMNCDKPAPKTPKKDIKRVRFSDPGPAPGLMSPTDTNSTGLTPWMKRTTMQSPATARRITSPRPHVKRRISLPAILRREPRAEQANGVQFLQFTPYRQTIDGRMVRRLKRSHMSEELNKAQDDYRVADQALRELATLRKESEAKEKRIQDLVFELESQRQLGIHVNSEEEAMLNDLRKELCNLRDAVNAKEDAVSSFRSNAPTETDYGTEIDFGFESIPYVGSPSQEMPLPSPCQQIESITPGGESPTNTTYQRQEQGSESPVQTITPPQTPTPELERRLQNLTKELASQSRAAVDARAALDIVRDELRQLGISPDGNADIEQIIVTIGESFRKTRIELEGLLPGETPGGFDNSTLLRTLLAHIRKLVSRVEEGERSTFQHAESERALRGNFNAALTRINELETRRAALQASVERKDVLIQDLRLAGSARKALLARADDGIADLQTKLEDANTKCVEANTQLEDATTKVAEADTKLHDREKRISELLSENANLETSAARLQSALESYRAEVANLEGVVEQLDEEKKGMARAFASELKKALEAQAEGLKMAEGERDRMGRLCEAAEEVAGGSAATLEEMVAL